MNRSRFFLAGAALFALPSMLTAAQAGKKSVDRFVFAGYEWTVKRSERPTAPQKNRFGPFGTNVLLRSDGALVLRIAPGTDGRWRSAEVVLSRPLGYGIYRFRLASRLDGYDDAIVAGLFTWDTRAEYAHREIDIEFSTWGGQLRGVNAQYVVQPSEAPDRLHRFDLRQGGDYTSHELRWKKDRIDFASWHGHGTLPPRGSPLLIQEWYYAGTGVPPEGDERIRINLYLFEGKAPGDGKNAELIVSDFQFEPYEDGSR